MIAVPVLVHLRVSGAQTMRMTRRQLAQALLLSASLWASAGLASTAVARDWLDLRRAGAAAILADARHSAAPQPWRAEFSALLPLSHPLAQGKTVELRLTVVRLPQLPNKAGGPKALSRVMVRFDAPEQLKGSGIVADGKQLWVKVPKSKAVLATPGLLHAALPGLQLPLQVFALPEVVGEYDFELEGEFGDSGVIRCKPRYQATPGVLPGKIGVHKRWGTWTLVEMDDRDGKRLALAEWLDLEDRNDTPVPQALRLRPMTGDAAALTLKRRSVAVGSAVEKVLSAKLLR